MTAPHPHEPRPAAARLGTILRILAAIAGVVALVLLGRQAGGALQAFAAWVQELGAWAPAVFIVGYAIAVAALVPGSILTMAAGALFGLAAGTLYVFIAAVLGSTLGFLIARHFARGFVERRIADNPKFLAIDRAIARDGLKITFLLRLSPVFPFSFLNYALGLTRVSLRDYALASFGMLPGTLLYVYYGKVIGDVARLASGAPERDPAGHVVSALGLLATIAVTVYVTRIARRALAEETGLGLETSDLEDEPAR